MTDDTELATSRRQRGTTGLGLFDSAVARDADPITSHAGHDHIQPKRVSLAATLLAIYKAYPDGLTDREASQYAGIEGGWKRCADLRKAGLIRWTGATRGSPPQGVCEAVP